MRKAFLTVVIGISAPLAICLIIYLSQTYLNASHALEKAYHSLPYTQSSRREAPIDLTKGEPISILLMGIDKRPNETGRSDILLLITLDPKNKSMKLVSIPRDTYTKITYKNTYDKINHAYYLGKTRLAIKTVEDFLDIPVDFYVEVNMEGFKKAINAIGGVNIHNETPFSFGKSNFPIGNLHLDGTETLNYVRMRKEDPRGDFGRQMRERKVIQSLIMKSEKLQTLSEISTLLNILEDNVKTNFNKKKLYYLQKEYRSSLNNVEEIEIEGQGKLTKGVWYYYVDREDQIRLSHRLKEELQ